MGKILVKQLHLLTGKFDMKTIETPINILIIGSTGNTGSAAITHFEKLNIPVKGLTRNIAKAQKKYPNRNIEWIEGSLNDLESLKSAIKGITSIYVAVPVTENMVQLFNNLLVAASESQVDHVVKLSGLGAEKNSTSKILKCHSISDQQLINSGIEYTILRPNSFFQNILLENTYINRRGYFSLPMADSSQSLVDLRDVGEAIAKAIISPRFRNKIFNITGPTAINYHEMAGLISDRLGKEITYKPCSQDDSKKRLSSAGLPNWNADALSEIQHHFQEEQFSKVFDDLSNILEKKAKTPADFILDFFSLPKNLKPEPKRESAA